MYKIVSDIAEALVSEEMVIVDETAGYLQAEIMRGVLEAQGISVLLSQEGAGHWAYAATVGTLGRVRVYVPAKDEELARQIVDEYYAGTLKDQEFPEEQVKNFLLESPPDEVAQDILDEISSEDEEDETE